MKEGWITEVIELPVLTDEMRELMNDSQASSVDEHFSLHFPYTIHTHWVKNKRHHDSMPAEIVTQPVGITKTWFKDGKVHNESGPATSTEFSDGGATYERYYLYGKGMSYHKWCRKLGIKEEK
jgi:hypothetical protein